MERRRRVLVLTAVLVLSVGLLAGLAVTASEPVQDAEGAYPGDTLVTVQAYGWFDNYNGEVFAVTPSGERVWSYQPGNSAVFDGEYLDNGNVLVSHGQRLPNEECPEEFQNSGQHEDHCVHNRVSEVDPETDEVVWEYSWYDDQLHWHEVHDADRLANGETAIIDMGRDRAFTVDRAGEVTWEWRAEDHISEGTPFWEEHVPADQEDRLRKKGPHDDWTHMNDIDRLENGNFQLSIRNYDVLLEVDPETNDIVDVFGEPGNHSVIHEQHNPHRVANGETVVVADSENDRIVEYDVETTERVWAYEGPGPGDRLQWPRDADRLPNGNTLVVDSRNFRVLEVDRNGSTVWTHDMADERAIVYDADRLGPDETLGEEPTDVPSGRTLSGRTHGGPFGGVVATAESWLGFVVPPWLGLPGVLVALVGLGAALGLCWEGAREYRG